VIEVLESLSGRRLDVEHVAAAAGDVKRTAADTTRARTDLGWEPRTTLADGLAAQLAWASPGRRRRSDAPAARARA
jgi:UDP-glucuronate 4-epimerase